MIATFTVINLIFKTIAFRHLVSNTFFVFFFKSICAFLKQSQSLVGIHPHRSRLKFTKGSWEEINSPTAHRLVLYVWNMSIWTVLLYHLLYFDSHCHSLCHIHFSSKWQTSKHTDVSRILCRWNQRILPITVRSEPPSKMNIH